MPTQASLERFTVETANSNKTMVIILAIVTGVMALIGLGVWWWSDAEATRAAEASYAKAQDACEQGQALTCLDHLNEALRRKEKVEYLELKYNALDHESRRSESLLTLNRLLAMTPDHPHYNFLKFEDEANYGDWETAMRYLEKAVSRAPNNGDYKIAKATQLVENNRRAEALPLYKELIKEDPHYYHYWDQYALSYQNFNQYDQALKIRLEGLKQNPKDDMQYFGLGCLYDAMKKYPEAVVAYRKSLQLDPMEDSIAAQRIYEITGKRVPPELENLTSQTLPITSQGNVVFVKADLNGVTGRFLIDTGASFCVAPANKAAKFKLKPTGQVMAFQTGNGMIQSPIAYGNLRLGKHDFENLRIALTPPMKDDHVDGVIGMDVLQQFQFEINREAGTLTLRRTNNG
ncbi:MAG: aspartyl protease family protein [Vampirovibrionales bacterium]|nr:aspartyl protease family protein [Vampirovibrionales bacterium]